MSLKVYFLVKIILYEEYLCLSLDELNNFETHSIKFIGDLR